ncbi:SAM-dependent methyltransferase [Chamaesiphon minutus]|nr:SAM-dependent methyltransferase [Chamaesiphon minutus]
MFIDRTDSEQLNQIQQAVNDRADLDKIIELCKTISHQVKDRQFPLTYAGILLASAHRISEAISVLKLGVDRTFNQVLADYLIETQAFAPAATAFAETTPYDVWTQTDLYQSQMSGTLKAIANFARRTPPPAVNYHPTIIDIGPGNGTLLIEIIKQLLALYPIESIHLILIEQSPEMLAAAQKYCQASLIIPITFTPICCRIQEIEPHQWAIIKEQQPIWFVNASLSLHHMPKEIKVPTMAMLANLSTYCLLSDAHYNHDLPEKDTPELIYSVTENYGFVIKDVLKSLASETDKKLCINNFLLTEAINIIKNDRPERGDYHTLIGEWQEIANRGQWEVIETTPTVSLSERPFTFTMELKSKLLT